MTISIITPVLDHPEFIPDYRAATIEAECIIVDTGSTSENRKAWMEAGKLIDYPAPGHNYGHWCNAGYGHSTGDIVIFLNNDVRADGDWLSEVATFVQPGAIYGPELQAQTVGGITIPFLSGWCIAATRATWDRLTQRLEAIEQGPFKTVYENGGIIAVAPAYTYQKQCGGPWDTSSYPAAGYWEDNDLCFRAVMAGVDLIQTKWPIVHLDGGNGTSKHKKDYYADVERNKRTFERMVRAAMVTT